MLVGEEWSREKGVTGAVFSLAKGRSGRFWAMSFGEDCRFIGVFLIGGRWKGRTMEWGDDDL